MELLCWLNDGSLVTQNAAAGLPSIDDSEDEDKDDEPTNRLQVRQPLRIKKVKKVQDMELLDSLNAASFLVTQPAAAGSSLDRRRRGGGGGAAQARRRRQLCESVRHPFITQPDSNDPSR